ncbi:MAG TPA: FtsW/RodA/SpoVE family cell cycle protein, partial [Candidatus Saccharimonadales bacterium]
MRPSVTGSRRRSQFRLAELTLGRKHRPDYWLLILCAALLSIGLIVVYAISPALSAANHVSGNYYVTKQLLAIGLSLVAFIATARIPLQWWRQVHKPLLVAAGLATLLALIIPVNPAYPAHRWVRLGSLSFQSVELVKFAMLIWLAGFLAERIREGSIRSSRLTLRPILIALGAVSVIIVGV